jgi:hypothetical protein
MEKLLMNAKITEQNNWLQKMATLAILSFSLFMLAACGNNPSQTGAQAVDVPEGAVLVEIAYLNHSPVRTILTEIDALLVDYESKAIVARYDFGTPEGEAFAEERGLTVHTPIAIYVNGQMEFSLGGRTVKFYSFPQGLGTGVVPDGAWVLDDLQAVLDMTIAETE